MSQRYLIITSIANCSHPVLRQYAADSLAHGIPMVVIGDLKSQDSFKLPGCDYFSVERQRSLSSALAQLLPFNHYARKNLGYLVAMLNRADIIIETDDDNLPFTEFWSQRSRMATAHHLVHNGWVNVYKYFTELHVWPRGFALEHIQDALPALNDKSVVDCPIQQGLATRNPDVDAIYRLTLPLPIEFKYAENLALGKNSFCPFNSQNTTWFKDAFPLLYLPSYCSFRMTDIWRSFIAQRIAWECEWSILFHHSTVWQERNDHSLINDFRDEIPGFLNNNILLIELQKLNLKAGKEHIPENMIICYQKFIDMGIIESAEMTLLNAWLEDLKACGIG
jgi:hypothetical protein